MKRRLIGMAVLTAMILGCMTGCGEDKVTPDNVEDAINSMSDDELESAIIDGAEKLDGDESSETEEAAPAEITATDEILSAGKYDGKIQIGSKVYTFPVTVSELLASGELRLTGDAKETSLVDGGSEYEFDIEGTGVDLSFTAINETDSMMELKDCTVDPAHIYVHDDNYNVYLSGGIHPGMAYSEFIEIFGEPDYKSENNAYGYYEDFYQGKQTKYNSEYGSATGFAYSVAIDMDNACVSSITLGLGNKNTDKEEKEINFYHLNTDELRTKIICSMPGDFTDYQTILDINGTEYFFNAFDINYKKNDGFLYASDFPAAYTEDAFKAIIPDAHYYEIVDENTAIIIKRGDEYNGHSTYVTGDSWNVFFYDNDCYVDGWKFTLSELNGTNTEEIPEEAMNQALDYIIDICKTMRIEVFE